MYTLRPMMNGVDTCPVDCETRSRCNQRAVATIDIDDETVKPGVLPGRLGLLGGTHGDKTCLWLMNQLDQGGGSAMQAGEKDKMCAFNRECR